MRNTFKFIASCAFIACHSVYASNFAECILDKMPGTANDVATTAVLNICTQSNPGRYYDVIRGSGRGIFGYSSQDSCIVDKTKNTTHQRAAFVIAGACRCLYGPSTFTDEACDYRPAAVIPQFVPTTTPPAKVDLSTPQASIDWAKGVVSPPPTKGTISRSRAPDITPPETGGRKFSAQEQADVNAMVARAAADYPYLNTPAGAPVLAKIIARRDELIQQGVYPSIAITQAVNAFAPGNAPP